MPIILRVLTSYDGQTKLKPCNLKNVANMPINWPIISHAATFMRSLSGHNSAIFYPILTFKYTKMISSSRRIDWWKDLSSISFRSDFHILSHYLPPVATWTTMAIGSQNHTQIVSNWYTYHAQPITQNRCWQKIVYHNLTLVNFSYDLCVEFHRVYTLLVNIMAANIVTVKNIDL